MKKKPTRKPQEPQRPGLKLPKLRQVNPRQISLPSNGTDVNRLSNREILARIYCNQLEILNLLGQKMQNKEIAAMLFISPQTVKKHLNNIYGKLNISRRRQAVEKALTLGILTPP